MAENKINILLGYDDELITDKYSVYVNFATNKIGGKPDLPANIKLDAPKCPLCRLPRLLVLQIYAPIETTTYHRTLYLYACINPNCWNQNDSWICLRSQTLEQITAPILTEEQQQETPTIASKAADWCAEADDWDDDINANINEENGNLIGGGNRGGSDEEEESCSLEESVLRVGMEFLTVTDERNANSGEAQEVCGGAVGCLHSPCARAEIEAGECDVITIDSPTRPLTDITSLLHHTAPLPNDINCQQFAPYFISVTEERTTQHYQIIPDRHIRDLLQTYQQQTNDDIVAPAQSSAADATTIEKYEESIPAHGDKTFHYFATKLQESPGQILRYARGSITPLVLYPVPMGAVPPACKYCSDTLVFEFQVLPTLIQRLRLDTAAEQGACALDDVTRLEWGNVLVYTCRKSCWGAEGDFREEIVVVQKEL